MSEYACSACKTQWTHESRRGLVAMGWGVVALGAAIAVGMLVLIQQKQTGWGGGAAAAAMGCLGLGMWLQGRASPSCPDCGTKSVQPPADSTRPT